MCAAENDHYKRGFVLEEVPFEEEFEQTGYGRAREAILLTDSGCENYMHCCSKTSDA